MNLKISRSKTLIYFCFLGSLVCALIVGINGANAEPRFTPLNVWEYYNDTIETKMVFDGVNYLYVTPYGNYSITQPLNVLSFTDHNGKEVVEKSVFVLQYNQFGSWLPLLDFYDIQGDPVVTIANNTHFELSYNIYDKRVKVASAFFRFTVNENPEIKPKIEVEVSLTDAWDLGSFRWIWDIVPSSDYKYWRNQTTGDLKDINEFGELTELYNNTPQNKIRLHDGNSNSVGFLDVSDHGQTTWYAGQEPNWNTKGYVTIFPINESIIDPIPYTETAPEFIDDTTWGNGWNTDIDCGSAPANSVAEIIAFYGATSGTTTLGVRNTSSVLNRYLSFNEAEDGGITASRFLVQVDSSGNVDFYEAVAGGGGEIYGFYLVGYWEEASFTEQWVQYNTLASEDDQWWETDGTELSLQANRTHLISLINENTGSQDYLGVRNTSSSLDRRLEVMEAEGGGAQTASMFVQSDVDSKIDVYTSDYGDVYFINQGYFDETITFQEDFVLNAIDGDNSWTDWDLSAYLDQDGVIVDVLCTNVWETSESSKGARIGGSVLERRLLIREAEGGGHSGYGMTVKTDINGRIEIKNVITTSGEYFFTGYFIGGIPPYSPNITTPNLLFGAGFNDSAPFVNIRWNHSGTVDNYEIHHGITNTSLTFLAFTSDQNYTHTGLVNGSYHWYKIRSTHFLNGTWYNSSFSLLNLERVYYVLGGERTIIEQTFSYEYRYYNVTSFDNKTGVLNYGGLLDIAFVDSLNQSYQEVVGSPGFDIRFNWTSIPENITAINILIRAEYTGNLAHEVWIEVYNFSSGSWVELMLIPDGVGFEWYNGSISGFSTQDFLNNGKVWIKVDHESAGNINHKILFDYVQLRGIIPLEAFPLLGAWDINWITALIWIALTAIGIMKADKILVMFAGFFGIILGLLMLSINAMLAIALILFNLYLVYSA